MNDTILDVRHLSVDFQTDERLVRAVDDVSFQVKRGQTVGIVGESGSGKSVTSLAVMGLVPNPPGRVSSGEIWFRGLEAEGDAINLLKLPSEDMQKFRGGQISMIFQEPMSSLNPVYTCGYQLTEAIQLHQDVGKAEARRKAIALLQEVQLIPTDDDLWKRHLIERNLVNIADLDEEFSAEPTVPVDLVGTSVQVVESDRLQVAIDRLSNRDRTEIQQDINRYKQSFLDRYPHELSGGQIQRVMIAMSISCNPSLLIADEPTTALDVTVQARILNLMRELRDRRGMSLMFITHDLSIVAEIADMVVVMYQGKIVEYGTVWDIFSNPQHPYTKGLLACRPQPDKRLRYLPTIADFMEEVETPTGEIQIQERQISVAEAEKLNDPISEEETHQRLAELKTREPLVRVEDFKVAFPVRGLFGQAKRYIMAVDGVSFQVNRGETLGLVGESGCGKTTLSRALLKLVRPSGGRVWFEGRDVTDVSGRALRQLRRNMQIIFQDPFSSLDPRMTIGAAIMEPLRIHGVGKSKRNRRERTAYLLERVGLNPNCMNRYPHEFSGGQRQRICVARALALNPKFIICDESVSALDVSVQAQVLNLLKELQQEFDLTYIFISHDLSVVEFMSDRIMVMNDGKIEETGPAGEIYYHPSQPYTQRLIASIPVGSLERIKEQQMGRMVS